MSGVLTVRCAACRAVEASGSRESLRALGWLDMAVKGKLPERWPWRCPACAPRGDPRNFGRSTP